MNLDIKIFLGDDDEGDEVEVIDEEIEDLATEENQITVTGEGKEDTRASSVVGKYQANANGKGKSRTEPENSMEGFGGIVGIGQQKKQGGSVSVQNPSKKNDDPKGSGGTGLGIGLG